MGDYCRRICNSWPNIQGPRLGRKVCRHCGKKISTEGYKCPCCGLRLSNAKRARKNRESMEFARIDS